MTPQPSAEGLLELMRARRSVRRFKPQAPDRATLERLFEAAVAAPSASNQQPWRFFVVRDRALIERLAAAVRESVARIAVAVRPSLEASFRAYGDYFTRFEGAPVVVAALFRGLPLLTQMVDDRLTAEDL
ncbi:MAG: nitroreductase family protein, partial [Candidatus Wallbacteria bacterium]|nr:nitroreductase family protein [Candidatus Wallbacteria bacterium]